MEKRRLKWPENAKLYFDMLRHEIRMSKPYMAIESYSRELGKLSVYPYIVGAVKKGTGFIARLLGKKLVEFEHTKGEEGEIRVNDRSLRKIVSSFVSEHDPRNYGLTLDVKMAV